VIELVEKFFSLTTDPSQRLYWPFLISSVFIIMLVGKKGTFKQILHPSSLLDMKILSINLVLKVFLFPLFLFSSFSTSLVVFKAFRLIFPYYQGLDLAPLAQSVAATLVAFSVNDFFRFFQHFLMHKSKTLFTLHKTHHSATVLTPLTLFRAHPLESLLAGARNILSLSITIALFAFLFKGRVSAIDILGVNAFGMVFNAALSNLRHSPIPISFGPLEYFLISPRMHQIHHSNNPAHFNKNYGVALSIWDHLCGSFYRPSSLEAKQLSFGLHQKESQESIEEATTLKGALLPGFPTLKNNRFQVSPVAEL